MLEYELWTGSKGCDRAGLCNRGAVLIFLQKGAVQCCRVFTLYTYAAEAIASGGEQFPGDTHPAPLHPTTARREHRKPSGLFTRAEHSEKAIVL